MSSIWNNRISISIFGESHGPAIGVIIDNLPPGEYIDSEELARFMARRAPKKDGTTTSRSEKDMPQIISGMLHERTTGTPLCAFIQNTDTHSADYSNISKLARPGHADYTGALRYKGFNDVRGGGHFSGRLTAPLCFAGAVCGQILERRGIYTGGHILSVHNIKDSAFDYVKVTREDILKVPGAGRSVRLLGLYRQRFAR
ncbi:MAG: chorismate synthase, partial [Ruminococcus sp.]